MKSFPAFSEMSGLEASCSSCDLADREGPNQCLMRRKFRDLLLSMHQVKLRRHSADNSIARFRLHDKTGTLHPRL